MRHKKRFLTLVAAGSIVATPFAHAQLDDLLTIWVAAGQQGAPCGSPTSCAIDQGYGCVDGFCTPTGEYGQMCRPWGHPYERPCEPELVCSTSHTCVQADPDDDTQPIVDIYANPGSEEQLLAMGAIFARLCEIVYKGSEQQQSEVAQFEMAHREFIDGAGDTQAMVVEDDHAVVVVLRGTQTEEFVDWLVDLQTQVRPLPGYGSVHLGFSLAAEAVREAVESAIDASLAENPDRQILLTGHSLGGAVAPLLAAMLEVDGYDIAGVTVFGAPAAGDSIWRDRYNAKFGALTQRWVRGEDIVPCLPPSTYWKHVGTQHYLSDTAVQFYDSTNYCSEFPNILNPVSTVCGQENKIARYLRRIFLDPANLLCLTPDPLDGILNAIVITSDGRGAGDHPIEGYADALQSHL